MMPHVPVEERAARRVGTILAGKYGIERLLGVGGMATVYMAVHRNGRRVALKLLHEELGIHGDVRARFVREGYVANTVAHPGAVLVFDDDVTADGTPFLVMEMLEGETLEERCRRRGGRLPCREVLALAHQLLDVLAAAHAHGVVHRDIKPENLFLTQERVLKVLDFGVARLRDETSGALATMTGARIGTPAYMPPEQALGRSNEVDARTDLWAVGATMFALLAGRTVHTAQSAAELIVITATTPAPAIADFSDLPAEVAAVIDRALCFVQTGRWPDARAMQRALEEAHLQAFGAPLVPSEVGPLPEPRAPVPRLEDDKETLASGAQKSATPAADVVTRVANKATPISASTWRSDRPPPPAALPKPDPTLSPSTLRTRESPAPGSEKAPSTQQVSKPRSAPSWAVAVASTALVLAGAAYGWSRFMPPALPHEPGGSGGTAQSGSSGSPKCVANADCKGDKPAICRKDSGQCVALASEQCKVLASPGDVENDATVWVGAMFPIKLSSSEDYGPRSANAIELARRDFAETTGGLPPVRPGGPKRPLAIVLCDDREAPEKAANHLVHDLHLPAILGFARSKEVMDLASSLFLPEGVLALASNTASTLRDIPHAPGEARLVWRVTTSADMVTPAVVSALSQVVEPEVRATLHGKAAAEPLRIAMLRVTNPSGQAVADLLTSSIRFNGKSVAENGSAFRQLVVADGIGALEKLDAVTLEQAIAFAPHIILLAGTRTSVVAQLEAAWPAKLPFRPHYLYGASNVDESFVKLNERDPELRKRYYGVDTTSSGETLTRYVLRYNEVFAPPMRAEDATAAPYDAFYVFAYAAAALGEQPITGKALAAAMTRLTPPGDPVDVGPGGIYRALYALQAGKNIDLRGAVTTLDFNPETGDATASFSLFCMTKGTPEERPHPTPSGLFFDPVTKRLQGTAHCP